jgi:hypothetical protein
VELLIGTADTGFNPIDLASQVPLVLLAMVVFWAFYKLWAVPGPLHAREQRRADAAIEENNRLRGVMEDKVLAALIRSNDLLESAVRVLDLAVETLDRTSDSLEGLDSLQREVVESNREVLRAVRKWE